MQATTARRTARGEVEAARPAQRERRSLFDVTPDIACLQQPLVNLYFFGERGAADHSWVLIDAGLPFFGAQIRNAAAERFGSESRPAAIILTHGHFDHVGGLPELAELWDVPVYAHELELPYLTGRSSYPPPDPSVGGGAMSLLSPLYPKGPINLGSCVRALPADGSVPGMPDWRWIPTPGHSPGHVSLFRDSDRTLIAGDAFVTTKQESALGAFLQWNTAVRRPPAYFTPDWQAARRSVERLMQLQPNIAATGHGIPMSGEELRQELATLVRDWEENAVPAYGRYVGHPALTNESGVVSLPPPVVNRQLLIAAGLGAVAIGLLVVRGASRQTHRA